MIEWLINFSYIYFSYEVEFSKPKLVKPIPEGTVKVFFSILEETPGAEPEIEFNFENESLKHRVGNTMRNNRYEVSVSLLDAFYIYFLNYSHGSIMS